MKVALAVIAAALWAAGRTGWSVLVALALILLYVAQAVFFPFGHCWVCKGNGRWYRNEKRKSFRDCWWCAGTGRRKRVVRRVYDKFRGMQQRAS